MVSEMEKRRIRRDLKLKKKRLFGCKLRRWKRRLDADGAAKL